VGAYFSLPDWHHPDYPAITEEMKPYVFGASPPMPSAEQADRYHQFVRAQLTELLTGYGPIDVVWFDGAWERPADWWRPAEIADLVRTLQPGVLINNRLPGQGDFETPEQFIPATSPNGRWESCLTMNESWGWNTDDPHYKSARQIVHLLCETAGRGGNLLLNVSPRGDGSIPPEQLERLDDIGRWMERHHSALHGTRAGLAPWQFYGPSTRREQRINLFLLTRPYDSITVRGLPIRRIKQVVEVSSGTQLAFETRAMIMDQRLPDPDGEVRIIVPEHLLDEYATVVAIDIEPRG
jgi:alpha-L-fucosidase